MKFADAVMIVAGTGIIAYAEMMQEAGTLALIRSRRGHPATDAEMRRALMRNHWWRISNYIGALSIVLGGILLATFFRPSKGDALLPVALVIIGVIVATIPRVAAYLQIINEEPRSKDSGPL